MPSGSRVTATAAGKVILFGEHAVVYGRPAIAVPVTQVRAVAKIAPNANGEVRLLAPDLGTDQLFEEADEADPIAATIRSFLEFSGLTRVPAMTLTVTSMIPIASGLGSGAAISVALIRALGKFVDVGRTLTKEDVSALVYEVEKIHHGTPSGIDNTVVSYEQPVYFVRKQPENQIDILSVGAPLSFLIADSGVASSTKEVVSDVRVQWRNSPLRFERLFDGCGRIARSARIALEGGDLETVGDLMTRNHAMLRELSVSAAPLDRLVDAAIGAGAIGAKLSGAGRGGNVIALVDSEVEARVRRALLEAGAVSIIKTIVK